MKKLMMLVLVAIVANAAKSQTPIQIEYLLVPDDKVVGHESLQEKEMTKYHQKLLDEKKIYAWYHYRSRFPLGSDETYNYIIVTVCSNYEVLEARNKDMAYQEMVTRREVYYPNRVVRSPDYGVIKTPYISVDFLERGIKDEKDYTSKLSKNVKPLLDQRVADRVVVNYSVFDLQNSSDQVNYDHVLVTRCGSFAAAQVPAPIETTGLNERKKTVLWELLEIVF